MVSCGSLLAIDVGRAAERIETDIRVYVETGSAQVVIIGLSGGLDSAVVSALAVRALGAEQVTAYYLYDRDSAKQSRRRAELIADWLGVELRAHDIEPAMRGEGIYVPVVMRLTVLSGFINRFLNSKVGHLFFGNAPFLCTLHGGEYHGGRFGKFLYDHGVRHVEAAFNARHRYRRRFLEQRAREKGGIVLGAANRSERMVGWFVKGGIDDMPFSPLGGLYKTQVREVGFYLGLPAEVIEQAPSPDMIKGMTDELAIGIDYASLDVILEGIGRGMPDERIVEFGVSAEQIDHVRTMRSLSAWKREG